MIHRQSLDLREPVRAEPIEKVFDEEAYFRTQ